MRVILILVLTVLAVFVALPRSFSLAGRVFQLPGIPGRDLEFKLGLDLSGGSHLVFEADVSKVSPADQKDALEGTRATIERRVNLFGISEASVKTSKVGQSNRIVVELPGIKDTQQAIDLIGQTASLEFLELREEKLQGEATPSAKLVPTDLTGRDLKKARVEFDRQKGTPVVGLQFSDDGAKKFQEITKRNVGKPLAISLDGQVVTAPVVQQEITGGQAVITGNFTIDSARQLAAQLNSGALPLPVHLIEQRSVEATLGTVSVQKSLLAGVIGFLVVVSFMLLCYVKLGVFAVLSLLIFTVFSISIYKLIPIVLTLPGIAGFILSVGMAVDTNILVFERIKEEMRAGHSFLTSLDIGFVRAWTSIRDANLATLFIVFVLANPLNFDFLHTSGPVRGFAVALGIGVFLNLFVGIFVTKALMKSLCRG
jgi:preprotein translocase subunit SecD